MISTEIDVTRYLLINAGESMDSSGLNKLYNKIEIKEISNLIKKLREKIGNDGVGKYNIQVKHDGLLGSLRKLDFIFKKIKEDKRDDREYYSDRQEVYLVSFFHYYKSILEIIKKNFNPKLLDNGLYNDVTYIRNCFVHFYDKQFPDNNVFIRLDLNSHMGVMYIDNDRLNNISYEGHKLEIFDFNKSDEKSLLYINIYLLYSELYICLEELTKSI